MVLTAMVITGPGINTGDILPDSLFQSLNRDHRKTSKLSLANRVPVSGPEKLYSYDNDNDNEF